ncbi:RTA1-domain-containing protein [Trametes versicolor FP-101664 SS1]|uniref:RTA1-domain-containing protein n=1 Tax=Trametes versicolor (strain FP-101664) TaxID=717944 RepID=UPI0004622AE8|nr:RTA1-domain-containing protein [Trametes versicolor FP-101664 SS1]EIW56106.1 RTA1-domain-containing protein [Trametes versicolor FP-101664 SS1]
MSFDNFTSAAIVAAQTQRAHRSPYGYVPTEWICILFIALFAITTSVHLGQAVWSRLWWLLGTTVLAGVIEIIGWSGRLWSSLNPTLLDPFLMQITTTIIAPTPLIAANFVILGRIIKRLGQQYSRLSAMWYTIIFCSCDIIALIVQAIGGAKASTAVQNNQDPNPGGHIMLGGIAFQLAAVSIYMILAGEFLLRYHLDKPFHKKGGVLPKSFQLDNGVKLMIVGLAFDGVFILIRSIYRTIELTDGWSGRIIETQVYFNVLDGAMIVLAMFTLNFFHPAWLLGKADSWNEKEPSETDSERANA